MRSLSILLLLTIPLLASNPFISEGDSLYALRSVEYDSTMMLANPDIIDQAMLTYRHALSAASDSVRQSAYWKVLQCYYFKGTYTTADKNERQKIYNEGIDLCNYALELYPDSPGLHFWGGILWGYWSEVHGLLSAGRKGVAGKIRKHAETLISIDPSFAQGGGYRTLGAVHMKAPKIPLILGWPDKKKAVQYLEKAHAMNPANLITKKYYAQALAVRGEKKKAMQLLEEVVETDHEVHGLLEDAWVKHEAEVLLRELR